MLSTLTIKGGYKKQVRKVWSRVELYANELAGAVFCQPELYQTGGFVKNIHVSNDKNYTSKIYHREHFKIKGLNNILWKIALRLVSMWPRETMRNDECKTLYDHLLFTIEN